MPVTSQLTLLQNFEGSPLFIGNNTRYGGGQGASVNDDIVRSGIRSGGRRADNSTAGGLGVQIPTTNMSAVGYVIKAWCSITQWSTLNALNIIVASGSGNTVGDIHSVPVSLWPENFGFIPVWILVDRVPENGANANLSLINEIGIQVNIGDVGGNAQNVILDDIHGGVLGLLWTGTGGSFQDFRDFESVNNIGLFVKEQSGDLCWHRISVNGGFTDNQFTITFPDNPLTGVDSMGLSIDLDTATASIDMLGGSLKSANITSATRRPDLLVTGTTQTFFVPSAEGMRLIQLTSSCVCDTITLDALEITQGGSTIVDTRIKSRTLPNVALIDDVNFSLISNTIFEQQGTGHGVELQEGAENQILNNITWSGFGIDGSSSAAINYTGVTPITLSYNGGTKPTVKGNITVLDAQVTLTFEILDSDNNDAPIENARIEILRSDNKARLVNPISTNSLGLATTTVSFTENIEIEGWVRQVDLIGDDYTPQNYNGIVSSIGFSTIIKLSKID